MTRNQIEYAKLLETKRHNLKQEKDWSEQRSETGRHNLVSESQEAQRVQTAIDQAEETKRHNLATENLSLWQMGVSWYQADTARRSQEEAARHNTATEAAEARKIDESIRHNKAGEMIETGKLNLGIRGQEETERHNRVVESETQRHNYANEANDRIRAEAATVQASASMVSSRASLSQAETAAARQRLSEWTTYHLEVPKAEREAAMAEFNKLKIQSDIKRADWENKLAEAKQYDTMASAKLKLQQMKSEKWKKQTLIAETVNDWVSTARNIVGAITNIAGLPKAVGKATGGN